MTSPHARILRDIALDRLEFLFAIREVNPETFAERIGTAVIQAAIVIQRESDDVLAEAAEHFGWDWPPPWADMDTRAMLELLNDVDKL